jgi:uncharacterized protein YeaO (DUF488 family)
MIRIKRAYEPSSRSDGRRLLVERLWPRGIKKADLALDGWLKDVAPSTELRQWFGHDVDRWKEFQRKYLAELRANRAAWQPILDAAEQGSVTLIYSAHDPEHNGALVLRDYLNRRAAKRTKAR